VGRETLRTGGKILTDFAARKSTDAVSAADIVSKHVTEFAQNLINELLGRGRKSAREAAGPKNRGLKKGPMFRDIQRIKRAPRKLKISDRFS